MAADGHSTHSRRVSRPGGITCLAQVDVPSSRWTPDHYRGVHDTVRVYGVERQLHLWPQLDPGRIRTFIRSSMRVGPEWRSGRFSLRSWHCAISSSVSYSAGALRIVVHVYGPHRPCIQKSLVDFSPIVHRVRDLWSRNVADLL